MKRIKLILCVLTFFQINLNAQFVRIWEKSDALNNLPSWFSPTETRERGIAFSNFNGIPKLYVISNLAQPTVLIIDAMTGDSLGTLNTEGIEGGLLFLSDISSRANYWMNFSQELYACNLTNDATTIHFKIYVWETDTSSPQILVEDSISTFRIGDHLNLGMDWPNSHYITVSSNNNKIVDHYSYSGNPPLFRKEITLSDGNTGSNASADYNWVYPFIYGGSYCVNSDGFLPKFYDTLGVFQLISDPSVISTSSNSIKYYANGSLCCDLPFYVSYQYDENNAALVLSTGPPWESLWGETPSLGNNPNLENYGDVEYAWIEWNKLYIFVLSGNNGIGAYYAPGLALPVELSSFTATIIKGEVILKWQTATETNNFGFEVEKSSNNLNFENIGFIPGFGTTTEPKSYSFIDPNVVNGNYYYRLKQIDYDGTFEYSDIVQVNYGGSLTFSLDQNYPNPFNPSTKIKYTISSVGTSLMKFVQLKIFDVLGNEITTLVNEEKPAGEYEVEFNGASLPSGIYFYQMNAGEFTETRKMVLLR
jgi:hypothetical protein